MMIGEVCVTSEGRQALYAGSYNGKHLVTAQSNSSDGAQWGCNGTSLGASSITDGKFNTARIVASCAEIGRAAHICRAIGSEWFLPARGQLDFIKNQAFALKMRMDVGFYWSSSEYDSGYGFGLITNPDVKAKNSSNFVRCIREY